MLTKQNIIHSCQNLCIPEFRHSYTLIKNILLSLIATFKYLKSTKSRKNLKASEKSSFYVVSAGTLPRVLDMGNTRKCYKSLGAVFLKDVISREQAFPLKYLKI